MARYRGPKSKIARKFKEPIFGPDKVLERRNFPPGQHGPKGRRGKMSDYNIQLKEKQKVRWTYGLLEKQFKKYYDKDVFRAAGKRIRAMARAADNLPTEERLERITNIFATFRNPDKETVLTPWRIVNRHICIFTRLNMLSFYTIIVVCTNVKVFNR